MAKHTKGPWETDCSDHDQPYLNIKIRAARKLAHTICTVYIDDAPVRDYNDEQKANAARIVACVNALEGYNPDAVRDVVEALDWAIAEIEKRTRYSPDDYYEARDQRASALEKAKSALSLARLGGAS